MIVKFEGMTFQTILFTLSRT